MEGYENLRVLGEGTFGRCYLVNERTTKKLCVIKQIDMRGMTEREKTNTKREAYILEALTHPNIINFLGSFDSKPGYLNIVMSYADGGDLGKKIKEANGRYFSENIILGWFTQICLAIKHIHERRYIHRDLKCENVFMTKEGLVKLGDFGIAKSLKQSMEKVKTVVGTPYYMSPEICDNKQYTAKTDIWSLGVVLYEICCLQPPFQSNSLTSLALKICKGQYPAVPQMYSKQLRRLIAELLTVDPKQRPNIQQVMKSSIIQSRIEHFLNSSNHNQHRGDITTIEAMVSPNRKIQRIQKEKPEKLQKIQRIKPSLSPKYFDSNPSLIMLPITPTNVIKEGKIKVPDVKKMKVHSSRKREISEPVQSPKWGKDSDQRSKKLLLMQINDETDAHNDSRIPSQNPLNNSENNSQNNPVPLNYQVRQPDLKPKMKGKKIEEYRPVSANQKYKEEEPISISESFMFEQIPVQLLKDVINSERNLQLKQEEFENSVSMILKKYERESLELDFKEETQAETLQSVIGSRLKPNRFKYLLEIVKRSSGFPNKDQTKGLSNEQLDILPLISIYYGGYVMNMP